MLKIFTQNEVVVEDVEIVHFLQIFVFKVQAFGDENGLPDFQGSGGDDQGDFFWNWNALFSRSGFSGFGFRLFVFENARNVRVLEDCATFNSDQFLELFPKVFVYRVTDKKL